jgi:hypothetical protein
VGAEGHAAGLELAVEIGDAVLETAPLDAQVEVAEPQV